VDRQEWIFSAYNLPEMAATSAPVILWLAWIIGRFSVRFRGEYLATLKSGTELHISRN
jgi:hypothetical protein